MYLRGGGYRGLNLKKIYGRDGCYNDDGDSFGDKC